MRFNSNYFVTIAKSNEVVPPIRVRMLFASGGVEIQAIANARSQLESNKLNIAVFESAEAFPNQGPKCARINECSCEPKGGGRQFQPAPTHLLRFERPRQSLS